MVCRPSVQLTPLGVSRRRAERDEAERQAWSATTNPIPERPSVRREVRNIAGSALEFGPSAL